MPAIDEKNLPLSKLKVIKKVLEPQQVRMGLPILLFAFFMYHFEWYAGPDAGGTYATVIVLLFFFAIGMIVYTIWQYVYYRTYQYEFGPTSARISKGVISRETGFVQYDRVQNVYMDQDVADRILGLYDVHYETAGNSSAFYSHVDGLPKANANKLIEFLMKKTRRAGRTQKR